MLTDTTDILISAQRYVLRFFNDRGDNRLIHHDYRQTTRIVRAVEHIAQVDFYPNEVAEVAQLAAWFVNVGYAENYAEPLPGSVAQAEAFLQQQNYPTPKVLRCLRSLHDERPGKPAEQLLRDAVNGVRYGADFAVQAPLERLEMELIQQRKYDKVDWVQYQLQQLLAVRFYTDFGKREYAPVLADNLLEHKAVVEKALRNAPAQSISGLDRKFQNLERKQPNSGVQTFFRTNYRNHIHLSAIADNKANIMISVNAILISVIITILTYQNITEAKPAVLLPAVIFLCSGLTSLIFAVLSARPKVTNVNLTNESLDTVQRNIVFFGNFIQLDLERYEQAIDAVLRDGELLYGNMSRDLYFLGKVLDKKYRYLTVSYNVFMIGFGATVLTFLVAFLF